MYLSQDKINELIRIAAANDGHCDRCLRVIKVYKYQVSKTMAKIMKLMAEATKEKNRNHEPLPREIDMEMLSLTHTERSQLSKMRQHGLVVQPKDDRGVKRPRHWEITRKGWTFLAGEQIPAKVVVFDNQVLGHEGGVTDIRRLLDDSGFYEADPISTEEAAAYHDVRTPQRKLEYRAEWRGETGEHFTRGEVYDIQVERMQVGKPVHVFIGEEGAPGTMDGTYTDIAAFQRSWKIKQ